MRPNSGRGWCCLRIGTVGNDLFCHFARVEIIAKPIALIGPLARVGILIAEREVLGDHRRQSQESRLELRLHLKHGSQWRQFWVVVAEREDAGRFIVRADEKLTAFVEPKSAARKNSIDILCHHLPESHSR